MTSPAMTGGSETERALRWVGCLDHPFYNDERQRFIWYEASTIAFQLSLMVNLAVLAAMAWIGGTDALPYIWPMFVAHNAVAIVAVVYAKRKSAEYTPTLDELRTSRQSAYTVLLAILAAGLVRAHWALRDSGGEEASGFFGGFGEGVTWGIILLPVAIIVGMVIGYVMMIVNERRELAETPLDES